jgi:two-component system, NtrC family, response regulator HydG
MSQVLLIDDEPSFCQATSELLRQRGHDVVTANGLAAARDLLRDATPELILLDLMLPDGNGLELLEQLGEHHPSRVVIITGHPGIKTHIDTLTGPSVTFLTKPVNTRDLLRLMEAFNEKPEALPDIDENIHFGLMVGESEIMQTVYRAIRQLGPTDATVLIQGESGTGKELVAEALYKTSGRSGEFVAVNCGGLTKELVASELFGHEKGSFTGATRRRIGYFERAHAGMLFLDEITEMPADLQAHLLRALETGHIVRVGAEQETNIDARLVAATNQDPIKAVENRTLRKDLYYRLSEFVIRLPPLRERADDIELLVNYFIKELNVQYETRKVPSQAMIERFRTYEWPGNVRELKHAVHRAFLLTEDDDEVDLPAGFETALGPQGGISGVRAGRAIREVEKELILKTLEHFDGDKKAAAETLGISLKTLYNRLHEYENEKVRSSA